VKGKSKSGGEKMGGRLRGYGHSLLEGGVNESADRTTGTMVSHLMPRGRLLPKKKVYKNINPMN